MSKINIDHIIGSKIENINFDFKAEYWDRMEKGLDANCAKTNTCSSSTISGWLIGGLITTFVAVLSIILFFPWDINQNEQLNNTSICSDDVQNTELTSGSNMNNDRTSIIVEKATLIKTEKTKVSETQNTLKTKKHHSVRIKSKTKKVSKNTDQAVEKQIVDVKIAEQDNTLLTDSATIEQTVEQIVKTSIDSANKEVIDSTKPIQKEVVDSELDSVYIPDGKLLGNDKEDVEEPTQVEVSPGIKPLKNVKTKSKPIKRVFKKRKGILYRLGLRK